MYSHITNPETGRKVSINNKLGKSILSKYLSMLNGGDFPSLGFNSKVKSGTSLKKFNNIEAARIANENDKGDKHPKWVKVEKDLNFADQNSEEYQSAKLRNAYDKECKWVPVQFSYESEDSLYDNFIGQYEFYSRKSFHYIDLPEKKIRKLTPDSVVAYTTMKPFGFSTYGGNTAEGSIIFNYKGLKDTHLESEWSKLIKELVKKEKTKIKTLQNSNYPKGYNKKNLETDLEHLAFIGLLESELNSNYKDKFTEMNEFEDKNPEKGKLGSGQYGSYYGYNVVKSENLSFYSHYVKEAFEKAKLVSKDDSNFLTSNYVVAADIENEIKKFCDGVNKLSHDIGDIYIHFQDYEKQIIDKMARIETYKDLLKKGGLGSAQRYAEGVAIIDSDRLSHDEAENKRLEEERDNAAKNDFIGREKAPRERAIGESLDSEGSVISWRKESFFYYGALAQWTRYFRTYKSLLEVFKTAAEVSDTLKSINDKLLSVTKYASVDKTPLSPSLLASYSVMRCANVTYMLLYYVVTFIVLTANLLRLKCTLPNTDIPETRKKWKDETIGTWAKMLRTRNMKLVKVDMDGTGSFTEIPFFVDRLFYVGDSLPGFELGQGL